MSSISPNIQKLGDHQAISLTVTPIPHRSEMTTKVVGLRPNIIFLTDPEFFKNFLLYFDGRTARALITLQMKKQRTLSSQEKKVWADRLAHFWLAKHREPVLDILKVDQFHPFMTTFGRTLTCLNLTKYDLTSKDLKPLVNYSVELCPNLTHLIFATGEKLKESTQIKFQIISQVLTCFKSLEFLDIRDFWKYENDFTKLRQFIPQIKKLTHFKAPTIRYHETYHALAQDIADLNSPPLFDDILKATIPSFVKKAIDNAMKADKVRSLEEKTKWRYQRIANWATPSRSGPLGQVLNDKNDLLTFMQTYGEKCKELHLRVTFVFSLILEERIGIINQCPNVETLEVPQADESFIDKFSELSSFKKLEHLRVEVAKISKSWLRAFTKIFPTCPNLRTIHFSYSGTAEVTPVDDEVIQLLKTIINQFSRLEHIDLRPFKLSDDDMTSIFGKKEKQ